MLIRFVRADNQKEVHLEMTFDEWMERIYSDSCSRRWCIDLDDGCKAFDYGIIRNKSLQTAGNWPMTSSAVGVHPDEVPGRMEFDKAKGVPTEYTSDGDPIFTSKAHRTNYCQAYGVHDRNAGYSDPVPERCK